MEDPKVTQNVPNTAQVASLTQLLSALGGFLERVWTAHARSDRVSGLPEETLFRQHSGPKALLEPKIVARKPENISK